MKAIIVGLGSMGKRRIRILQKLYPNISLFGVDNNLSRCMEVRNLFNINTSNNLEEALTNNDFRFAFVCTSPLSHSKIIMYLLNKKIHVFSEINLVSKDYEVLINVSISNNCRLFLSSTFLYRDEINFLYSFFSKTKSIVNYSYHVGQYLPDWHPWESYKEYFIGQKDTNACKEIMAIEIPWLVFAFSSIKSLRAISSKVSELDISYPDAYSIIISHTNGSIGSFTIDINSRQAIRKLNVSSSQKSAVWEGTPDSLKVIENNKEDFPFKISKVSYENNKNYNSTIIENAYENEVVEFVNSIDINNYVSKYDFAKDLKTLNIIDNIENNGSYDEN